MTQDEEIKAICNFVHKLVNSQKDLEPEFDKLISKNFNELTEENKMTQDEKDKRDFEECWKKEGEAYSGIFLPYTIAKHFFLTSRKPTVKIRELPEEEKE
jgi:hypothetical protein